jgi:hypothetical protein
VTQDELDELREIAGSQYMIPRMTRNTLVELLAVYDAADTLTRAPLDSAIEAQARINLEALMATVRP